ncbi:MAG: hypothetical protein IKB52_03145 [Kiritimatiellae bacterium]|nr:hypothetical protein [Kiritimatiellia bacterium]MBR2488096.1 hypothetical protein [Kiritimatiellia bacterium]
MVRFGAFAVAATLSLGALGSWYWPFGSDDEEVIPRISELMEPASTNIDAATDFEFDGKFDEAIAGYEAALRELDKVEAEYPDQMDKPEFTTVKTKRAYVRAKIDTLKFLQVKENSKAVAVSDTTELEKKLAAEKAAAAKAATPEPEPEAEKPAPEPEKPSVEKPAPAPAKPAPKKPAPAKALSRQQRIAKAIADGDYAAADADIAETLRTRPNDAAALNLRAMMESAQGKYRDAEHTLDQAIQSNPKSYHAYYNMARLILKAYPDNKDGARRYYETGRAVGGSRNAALEEAVK